VLGGSDIATFEIELFERITSSVSLGDIDLVDHAKLPQVDMFITCSLCQDFCPLSNGKMPRGLFGKRGARFPTQFRPAKAAAAKAIIWENVPGVLSLHDGLALTELRADADSLGYGRQFYFAKVHFAEHGEPENRTRIVGVAFADSVQLQSDFIFPEQLIGSECAGSFLLPSTQVPAECWEDRPWSCYRITSGAEPHLRTMGFCNRHDTVGTFSKRSRVWHMMGTCPTALASGNSQLVLAFRMRSLCPLYRAYRAWIAPIATRRIMPLMKGGPQARRITATEAVLLRGLPTGYPTTPEDDVFRCVGGGVPIRYFTRLLQKVSGALMTAGVQPTIITHPPGTYSTDLTFAVFLRTPDNRTISLRLAHSDSMGQLQAAIAAKTGVCPEDQVISFAGKILRTNTPLFEYGLSSGATLHLLAKLRGGAPTTVAPSVESPLHNPVRGRARKGHNIFLNMPRHKLIESPVTHDEWLAIAMAKQRLALGNYSEGSKDQIKLGVAHWRSFCARFKLPIYLTTESPAGIRSTTAQAELFIMYEQAIFGIKASSACQKLCMGSLTGPPGNSNLCNARDGALI
jgi:hypothetical protein